MDNWLVAVVSVIATLAVVALVQWIRRTPTIGGPDSPDVLRPGFHVSVGAVRGTGETEQKPGVHITKTIVTRRVAITGQPGSESITVNGETYRSIDDVPDPAVREQLRSLVGGIVGEVEDPKLREKVTQELRDVGIEPTTGPTNSEPPADAR